MNPYLGILGLMVLTAAAFWLGFLCGYDLGNGKYDDIDDPRKSPDWQKMWKRPFDHQEFL